MVKIKTKETKSREFKLGIVYTQPSEGFWDIPGVFYRGEKGNYRLFEKMTENMTQDSLAELYETEKRKGNPCPTDMPLIWAITERAYGLRNDQEYEELRQFLRQGFRRYPITLTRIIYEPSGNDKIVHNYKTSDEYSIDAKVVGSNGWISEITDKNILEKILGTNDIKKINEISQNINGTNNYLLRFNLKPNKEEGRVAGFNADGGKLGLVCNRDTLNLCPAFRVLRVD